MRRWLATWTRRWRVWRRGDRHRSAPIPVDPIDTADPLIAELTDRAGFAALGLGPLTLTASELSPLSTTRGRTDDNGYLRTVAGPLGVGADGPLTPLPILRVRTDENGYLLVAMSGGTGGTVTSVAMTVPPFLSISGSPITTSGTLAVTLSGTALPIANGGTGLTAFGTGVATALGVNVGSAGAFVVNGGALGTPSSGTLTNATGLPEGGLALTDITTNDVSATKHGFAPKFPNNTTTFLRGDGTYAIPPGTSTGTVTSVSVTTANGVSGSVATATTTPAITLTLGAITPSTVNGNTFTTGTYVLTGAAGKTLTFSNTLTLAGTDATTMTFPTTSATIARTDAANTFTGNQVIVGTLTLGDGSAASIELLSNLSGSNDAKMLFGNAFIGFSAAGTNYESRISNTAITIGNAMAFQWNSGSTVGTGAVTPDTFLVRDAANTLAMRNATTAQKVRIYNTFTTIDTAGEWFAIDWITTANVCNLQAVKGSSTGTARVLQISYGGTQASPVAAISVPITSGNITFGGGITTPGGATFHTTNTALTDGAGVLAGTLGTAPAAGNPTKWIGINDNGTTRYIPAW